LLHEEAARNFSGMLGGYKLERKMEKSFLKAFTAVSALVLFGVAFYATQAFAQVQLPVIPIGIDRGTQDFVQRLPEELQKQVFQLLKDSLPLVDKSVEKYLAAVDEIIRRNVDQGLKAAQCTGEGIGAQLKDSIKSSLVGVFFSAPKNVLTPAGIPDTFRQLDDAISKTRDSIGKNTKASEVISAYADLLVTVAIVKCQTQIAALPVSTEVQAQMDRIYLPAIEWQVIVGKRDAPWCSDLRDCVVKRRDQVAMYLQKADSRDLKFKSEDGTFDGLELFKNLPKSPKAPSRLDRLFNSRVPILQYEDLLARLRYIERTVEARATERKASAKTAWDQAVVDNAPMLKLYESALGNWRKPTDLWVDGAQTIQRCDEVVNKLSADLLKAKEALALNPDLGPAYTALKAILEGRIADAEKLKVEAQKGLNTARQAAIRRAIISRPQLRFQ
jgi:hypothetical protein